MKKKLNISNIARSLKVSSSTVSKALNDRRDISTKTKTRVKVMAKNMGYKPDYLARALAMRKTRNIGLIVPDIEYSLFPSIARSVSDYLDKRGYRLMLVWSKRNPKKELSILKDLKYRKIDGMIVAPLSNKPNLSFFRKQLKAKYPLVTIDNFLPEVRNIPFVGTDFRAASFLATSYLVKLGHKEIGFMGPLKESFSALEKLKGYEKALIESGIDIREKFILDVSFTIKDGYDAVKRLSGKVTAILCVSDLTAIGVLNYLKRDGIKVPEEISVIGFGNMVEARNMEVPLSTVDQKNHLIGEKACEVLLKLIHMENIEKNVYFIEPELIVRKSTGESKCSISYS